MTPGEELRHLLRAERSARPPERALARGWERLADSLRAAPLAAAPAASALQVSWSLVTKWILVGVVVGGVGAAAGAKLFTPPSQPPQVRVPALAVAAAPSLSLSAAVAGTPVPAAMAPAASVAVTPVAPSSSPTAQGAV